MKLRRLMQIARRGQSLPKGSVVRHSKIAPPMTGSGQIRSSDDVRCTTALAPKTDISSARLERPFRATATVNNRSKLRSYSITSSAIASTPGGTVRPSDLATLRFSSSSNLANCTTGNSAGRAPLLYRMIANASAAFDREELRKRLYAMATRPPDVLRGISIPTLFVTGGEDTTYPPFLSDALAPLMPNARVEQVPHSGHSVYFQRATAFNGLADNFLSKVG